MILKPFEIITSPPGAMMVTLYNEDTLRDILFKYSMREIEFIVVRARLGHLKWNKSRAAKSLKIARGTLLRRMRGE